MRPRIIDSAMPALVADGTLYETDGHRMHWQPAEAGAADGVYVVDAAGELVWAPNAAAPPCATLLRSVIESDGYRMIDVPWDRRRRRQVEVICSAIKGDVQIVIGGGPLVWQRFSNAHAKRLARLDAHVNALHARIEDELAELLAWPADGLEEPIGVNAKYLLDALSHAVGGPIAVRGPLDAIVFGDEERGALVMPVRI